jgi:type IV pilus assembly protein PilC
MEFRCRLATPDGAITEEIHVADSESRLRHELEQKGLCVLALQPRQAFADGCGHPQPAHPTREFLVFNQNGHDCSKPTCRSCSHSHPGSADECVFKSVSTMHERVRAERHRKRLRRTQLFPDLRPRPWRGEEGRPRDRARRLLVRKVIGSVKRRTLSALVYPAVLTVLALVVVGIIVLRVVPAFSEFYETFDAELPLVTRIIVQVSTFARDNVLLLILGVVAIATSVVFWRRRPGQRARFDRVILTVPGIGPRCEVRHVAGRGRSRRYSAAGFRSSTRSDRQPVGRQPSHG